jgi:methylglyoxal synthase
LTFFGQPSENRAAIHEEIFNIVYYSQGFTHSDVYNLPLPLRRYYADILIKTKEKENEEMDKVNKQFEDPRLTKN